MEEPPVKRIRVESEPVAVGDEYFGSRSELQARVKEIQAAGEGAVLSGADAILATALLSKHPTLYNQITGSISFGEHARFPGAKCFLVTVSLHPSKNKIVEHVGNVFSCHRFHC